MERLDFNARVNDFFHRLFLVFLVENRIEDFGFWRVFKGEAGEVAEKVAKVFRDELGHFTVESKQAIKKELGDVLWYVSALANELGFKLSDVAACNLEKLNSRAERGVLKGSGDDR